MLRTMQDTHIIDRVSDEHLWDQVLTRQTGTDFLYAVTTMGVYCRPAVRRLGRCARTCASSDPRPRPRPPASAPASAATRRASAPGSRRRWSATPARFIEASEDIPSLDALAKRSGYSRFHFLRMFRDHTGLTPRRYAEGVRARRLHAALADGNRVIDAVAEAGFGSESRVYEKTATLLGMTPGAARRGGAGRAHPHRVRRLPVRPAAGGRHGQGRLLHRLRRTG